MSNPDI